MCGSCSKSTLFKMEHEKPISANYVKLQDIIQIFTIAAHRGGDKVHCAAEHCPGALSIMKSTKEKRQIVINFMTSFHWLYIHNLHKSKQ